MNVLNQLQTSLKCSEVKVLYKLLSSNAIIMNYILIIIG